MTKLVLVGRFEELTPGVRVVVACATCSGGHCGMVIRLRDYRGTDDTGRATDLEAAEIAPVFSCWAEAEWVGVTRRSVALKRVRRFVDLEPASETSADAAPKTLERVR